MRKHFDGLDGKAYDFDAIQADMSPEYLRLRRQLSLQENKEYKNITFVNDCATMVVRALKAETSIQIPKFIDASPSSIVMYFGTEKMAGSKRVESVRLVLGEKSQNPTLQLLRNAYINAREARLFYAPLNVALNQGRRAYFGATTTPKELQHFDEAFLERQRARFDDVEAELREDASLKFYLRNADRVAKDSTLGRQAKDYFASVYDEGLARIEASDASLDQILGALYSLQYYSNAEERLLKARSFDLKKALDDPEFYSEIQDLLESVKHLPNAPK
jgi:hypothetical protein